MALSQSELMRLLESLRRADGVEAIRVVCERILQELIEAEATEVIGAAPREHSESRTTWRNGHRERLAELHDEWQVFDRRYLSEASMAELFTTKPAEPEPQITPQPEPKQLP